MRALLIRARFLFAIFNLILIFLVYFILFRVFKLLKLRSQHFNQYLVKIFARTLLLICGISVKVEGLSSSKDFLAQDNHIFAVNHSSYFDHVITFSAIPVYFRIVALDMVYRFPIIGFLAKEIGGLMAIRTFSKKEQENNIKAMSEALEHDSILIYPEGHMTKDGKLLEFRRGIGEITKFSGKKVVPVIIKGAFELLPPPPYKVVGKGIWFFSYALFWLGNTIMSFSPREITVHFGEAMSPGENESAEQFSAKIRQQFLDVLGK